MKSPLQLRVAPSEVLGELLAPPPHEQTCQAGKTLQEREQELRERLSDYRLEGAEVPGYGSVLS